MIAVALSLFLAMQVTPELKQRVEAGLKAKAGGDFEAAAGEFRRVVELAPGLAAAHVNLGAVYLEMKNYTQAVPSLKKALELDANLPGAHAMLGTALLAQGYASDAIPHLEAAKADDLLGVALLESGRVREAVDRLESALQKRTDDTDLLYYLSQAHGRLSKQLFDRLREIGPESARAQQMSGEALSGAGRRDEAAQRFRSALELRPDLRGVHYALGDLYLESGDYENAEREFRTETHMVPGSAAAAYKLGLVLLNRGQLRDAIVELQRSNGLQPDMPETLLELGKALAIAGEAESAEKLFLKVLEHERSSALAATAHFQLAQIYRKLGRTADADRQMALFHKSRGPRK